MGRLKSLSSRIAGVAMFPPRNTLLFRRTARGSETVKNELLSALDARGTLRIIQVNFHADLCKTLRHLQAQDRRMRRVLLIGSRNDRLFLVWVVHVNGRIAGAGVFVGRVLVDPGQDFLPCVVGHLELLGSCTAVCAEAKGMTTVAHVWNPRLGLQWVERGLRRGYRNEHGPGRFVGDRIGAR